jgi:nitrite reductase/ring-hydroxylating ferredoxin subunit
MTSKGAPEAKRWLVGASGDVPERGRLVVDAADLTIGIYRLDDKLYAYENRCVHQGGPVCQGLLIPRVIEQLDDSLTATGMKFDEGNLHIVCPWHGFEYCIQTGSHPARAALRLRGIPVSEENGYVYVTV